MLRDSPGPLPVTPARLTITAGGCGRIGQGSRQHVPPTASRGRSPCRDAARAGRNGCGGSCAQAARRRVPTRPVAPGDQNGRKCCPVHARPLLRLGRQVSRTAVTAALSAVSPARRLPARAAIRAGSAARCAACPGPSACTISAISGVIACTAASRAARPDGLIATNLRRASSQSGRMWTWPAHSSLVSVLVIAPRVTWKARASWAGVRSSPTPCEVVQDREMRQLHPLGQDLGDAVAGQLIGHETARRTGRWRCRSVSSVRSGIMAPRRPGHGPARGRGRAPRRPAPGRARQRSRRARCPPSASTSPQGATARLWPWVRRPLPCASA